MNQSGKKLIICEKPSVARDISAVLGKPVRRDGYFESGSYLITYAIGHLVRLYEPQEYSPGLARWKMDTLPMLPEQFKLAPYADKNDHLEKIRQLIMRPDVGSIINACDAGREGELIFFYITRYLENKKPVERLWLSETTEKGIKEAMEKLRPSREMLGLGKAAVIRSQSDWLVGMNATRAYTLVLGDKFTVGRVQTPTLWFIVERERKIRNFVPEEYYELRAVFGGPEGMNYQGVHEQRIHDKSEADKLLENMKEATEGTVVSYKEKNKKESPPQLYDLTELQKDANKKFGYTAERTLQIAQALYERKLITYPRTDCRYLNENMFETLPERLRSLANTSLGSAVPSEITHPGKRFIDDSKVSDHTAIIMTAVPMPARGIDPDLVNLYVLIVKRVLMMLYPPARISEIEAATLVKDCLFITKEKYCAPGNEGYRVFLDREEKERSLPRLKKNMTVSIQEIAAEEKQTSPPRRFTESDLLSAMENAGRRIEDEELKEAMKEKGLGTPATRAAIIEKLIATGYVKREKKSLVPTGKGEYLIDSIAPRLKDPLLTAEWEYKLNAVAHEQYDMLVLRREIIDFVHQIIFELKNGGRQKLIPWPKMLNSPPAPATLPPASAQSQSSI